MGFWDSYNSAYSAARQGALAQQAAQTNTQISGALASGDYDGAAQAAFAGGNPTLGESFLAKSRQLTQQRALGALGQSYAGNASPVAGSLSGPSAPVVSTPQPAMSVAQTPNQAALTPPQANDPSATPDASELTVTGSVPAANLYDLTKPPVHPASPNTLAAAQTAIAAGASPEQVSQIMSLGHQLSASGDQAAIDRNDAVTKIAAQALNITAPDGNDAATQSARKNFVLNQLANVFPGQSGQQLSEAAQNFDYSDNGLQAFLNQHQAVADVLKNSRQDAQDAQKQENFEATQATTQRGQDLNYKGRMAGVGATIRGQNLREAGKGGYAPMFGAAAAGAAPADAQDDPQ